MNHDDIFKSHSDFFNSLPEPKGPGVGFWLLWAASALLGIGVTGVMVWAVIELVLWATSK